MVQLLFTLSSHILFIYLSCLLYTSGAHGFSMGYQYNAKLRSAEILYTEEGKARQIRRAERREDYFATLYGFDFEPDH